MVIRKRWPILFAAGSALAYLANNYQLRGLEQLRLETRPTQHNHQQPQPGLYGQAGWNGALPSVSPTDYYSYTGGMNTSPAAASSIFDSLPPWQPQLNLGEKLAVMQDQLSHKISGLTQSGTKSLTAAQIGQNGANGLSSLVGSAQPPGDGSYQGIGREINAATSFPVSPPIPLTPDLELTRRTSSGPQPVASNQIGLPRLPGTSPAATGASSMAPGSMIASHSRPDRLSVIRIASFNVHPLNTTKLAKPQVMEALTAIIRNFDIVALQGIQTDRDDALPQLVERLNSSGAQRAYDYLIGPRTGPSGMTQQLAFLFDTNRALTDRYQLYSVDDPENLVTHEPLVAWFRCAELPSDQAFTFTLVNVCINPSSAASEQAFLPHLIHAVVNDGRQEDDVILTGDFAGNIHQMANLRADSIRFAASDLTTDLAGQAVSSGMLFPTRGTCEYTGRSGVLDFLRQFNLSLQQAAEISQQLPVWAEFYVGEGAEPGRVAPPAG
ncbi:MAG: hypothetical protein KF752_09945 [Pirellulaceae bacterium]|nr:hypothetical protein [Pirellulaceae bacterium]